MTQLPADPVRRRRFKKARAAAVGFGLGATLALSPLVWAETPPADTAATQTPSLAIPQQSFAPLVKRVLPAVVNISVTEKSSAGTEQLSGQLPEDFRGAPFDDFLRRFFDEHGGQGQLTPRPFGGSPFGGNRGDEDGSGAKRIAQAIWIVAIPETEDEQTVRCDLRVRMQRELLPLLAGELLLSGAGPQQRPERPIEVAEVRVDDLSAGYGTFAHADGE